MKYNTIKAIVFFLFGLLVLPFILIFFLCLYLSYSDLNSYDYDKSKPTEFFKAKEGWIDLARSMKYENFVISNPPNDSALLRKMVEEYNQRTISLDTIKKYFPYERTFYLESKCLPRNYKEVKPCGEQDFRDHLWIMETHYYPFFRNNDYIDYSYRFNSETFGDTTGFKSIKIENTNLYFKD